MSQPAPTESAPQVLVRTPPLKVLDITDFYSETASGGVKTYLHRKVEYLEEAGISHAVVVPGDEDRMDEEGASRFHRVRGPSIPVSRAYRTMLSVDRIAQILREERPDVIEVGSPFFVPWLIRRAMGSSLPVTVGFYHADVVRTFAEPYVPYRAAAPLRVVARMAARRMVRDVYRRFDLTVAASRSVAEELRHFGVSRVAHVSLGVDLERFRLREPHESADRSALDLPRDRPVGVFVGRFAAEKRLDVPLDGHRRIPEAQRPHLVLVGDGPLRPRMEALARTQEHLSILPYQDSREELARIYGAADFYLAAGPGETFGLSIAEGLASGLPVVSVDRGAGPDRIEGTDLGELYQHGDPASAARALARMYRRVRTEGTGLRARARAHAEESFDWGRTFARLLELYRAVVARRA